MTGQSEECARSAVETDSGFEVRRRDASDVCREDSRNWPDRMDTGGIFICGAGSAEVCIGADTFQVSRDVLCVYLPYTVFRIMKCSADFHSVEVLGKFGMFVDLSLKPGTLGYYRVIRDNPCLEMSGPESERLDLLCRYLERCRDNAAAGAGMEGRILSVLSDEVLGMYAVRHFRPAAGEDEGYDLFARFVRLLDRHFRRERSVGFYARECCLTPRYFSTLIRKMTGMPVSEWIRRRVVVQARRELEDPARSVQEVAWSLGFSNASFFTRYFREATGMTPREYRRGKVPGIQESGPVQDRINQ